MPHGNVELDDMAESPVALVYHSFLSLLAQARELLDLDADYPNHPGRPGKVGGSLPRGQNVVGIKPVKERTFKDESVDVKTDLSKQATGTIGEEIARRWLQEKYGGKAEAANTAQSNFPVDVIHGDTIIEVKTGLVSNRKDAQKWRLTIGQPGKAETAWLKTASEADKDVWNENKMRQIEVRKARIVDAVQKRLKRKVKTKTVALILNPDTKKADIFEFDGFHPVIRWRSSQARQGYRGTIAYEGV